MNALAIVACHPDLRILRPDGMALAASRRSRLQMLVDAGVLSAARALQIKAKPSRFIAATQTGLTAASLLAGIFGEAALAGDIERFIEASLPTLLPSSRVAITTTVVVVTAFAIVFGEIVPKRIALAYPEKVASLVAPFLHLFTACSRLPSSALVSADLVLSSGPSARRPT